jgi:hypothetical protein
MAFTSYVMRLFMSTENLKGYAGGSIDNSMIFLAGQGLQVG